MAKHLMHALGFLAIFLMPGLLAAGMAIGSPVLAFGTVILVFPLMRMVFGGLDRESLAWHESLATALHLLPLTYPPALLAALVFVFGRLDGMSTASMVGLGLSLWMTLLFALPVAHELIHRRERRHRMVGSMLAGLAGYPMLAAEHLSHHARDGSTALAEWPRRDESVWSFAWRRVSLMASNVFGAGGLIWRRSEPGTFGEWLHLAVAINLASAAAAAICGGAIGLVLYLGAVAGVILGFQVITYIQHWGLGDDGVHQPHLRGRGWEDDCLFQAWVTLNTSLHDAHHADSRVPFYRLQPVADSPRLPAGYVVLMLLCMVPPLWRAVMNEPLEHWLRRPDKPLRPGRRMTCFGLYPR